MLVVKVTKEDIENGRPGSTCSCPVALAIDRATDGIWEVFNKAAENDGGCHIILPSKAIAFIRKFDATGEGEPFEFTVEP